MPALSSLPENLDSQKPLAKRPLDKRERGVTPRVVLFSLLLAAVFGYIIPIIDYKYMNTFLGATHLPPGAIGALLVLVLVVNPLIGVISQKLKFSRNEALTVYITCLFSCLVPGHGAENFIVPNLLAPFYFATRENGWFEMLAPYVKPWMTPALNSNGSERTELVDAWYLGSPQGVPWEAWIAPLLIWGTLILAVYVMMACLSAMLRKQWAEREAIAFPLLKLPLEMTQDMESSSERKTQFFRNGLMWTGFGIVVFIQTLRGLNVYFPLVPTFPLELELNGYFAEPPWNQTGWVPLRTYPLAVGIAFLLTSEISFSLWFFFWFMKAQFMAFYMLGYPAGLLPKASAAVPSSSVLGYQSVGCYLVFTAILLWTGREHFGHIAKRAFGRARRDEGESREVMSYPVAFWGFVLAFLFTLGWTVAAGVRLDLALVLWGIYLIYAIGLTRVAVEGGMLALLNDSAPLGIFGRLFGGASPGNLLTNEAGLVPASFIQGAFAVHMRGFSMPSYLHAFKLAYDRNISPKPLLALIAATVLVSGSIGMVMAVKLGYENGGLTLTHKWWATQGSLAPASFVSAVRGTSDNATVWNWGSLTFGGAFTYFMMLMRSRFAWFPLHPIGYLMAQTYPGVMFWFSFFLGWLFKVLILRFGGSDGYKRAIPFFLGVAFGDVAMMLLWLAIGGWQGRMSHALMPQ